MAASLRHPLSGLVWLAMAVIYLPILPAGAMLLAPAFSLTNWQRLLNDPQLPQAVDENASAGVRVAVRCRCFHHVADADLLPRRECGGLRTIGLHDDSFVGGLYFGSSNDVAPLLARLVAVGAAPRVAACSAFQAVSRSPARAWTL